MQEKQCLLPEKKVLKYFNGILPNQPIINFRLNSILDIFYSTDIPPIIKSKRNVIVVIENDNAKKTKESRSMCPDCLKEEIFNELKQKIHARMKDMILLIRKKLLRGLNKRRDFVLEEAPKPAFLIMDDLVAPFPEMTSAPIPVFSFAEDKPQERRKCKTVPERNEASKKDSHSPEVFYQWRKDSLLKANNIEPSPDREKPTPKDVICPPPLCPEECLNPPQNIDFLPPNVQTKNVAARISYNKNTLEAIPRKKPSIDKRPNKKKSRNVAEKKSENTNQDTQNLLNPTDVVNEVEEVSLSTLDLSNPSVAIIPILKPKEKGKRNITIKLKNIPDSVDVIKIRSIISTIYNSCEVKRYTNYFLKTPEKPTSYDSNTTNRRKIQNINSGLTMTCPNKMTQPSQKLIFPNLEESKNCQNRNPTWKSSSNQISSNTNLRCYKKNDCFYDE